MTQVNLHVATSGPDPTDLSEQGRRVAWAMYYEQREQLEKMLRLNLVLEERLAELVVLITESEAITVIEPDGELVKLATSVLGSLKRRTRGLAALRNVLAKRGREVKL